MGQSRALRISTLVRIIAAGATLTFGLAAAGCGGGAPVTTIPPPACPNDTPAACPAPAPSYAADVVPILESRCGACHTPGGVEPGRLFRTWMQVSVQSSDILSQIHTCRMPPVGQPTLTDSERLAVLGWIVCGAADN